MPVASVFLFLIKISELRHLIRNITKMIDACYKPGEAIRSMHRFCFKRVL